MRRGIKIAAGVIGAIIVVAVVAPMFVPLNSYKGLIADKAKAATGRDLKIDGDISLSLLPMPAVSVSGIKFGNAPGASTSDMVTLDKARVKVALMPLLGGNIEISEIVLEKPVIVLEKLKDGTANWQLKPVGDQSTATSSSTNTASPAKSSSSGMNVAIDGASIEDGTLIYRDATTGSEQKVDNVNVDLTMDSLQGPFSASGGVTALGMPLGFNVKLGKMDPTTPMMVDVMLSVSEANASIGFNGTADLAAASDPQKPIVVGKLSGKGDSVAKLLAILPGADKSATQPPLLSQAFSVDGDISAGSATATVKDLSLQLGDLNAKAAVAANYAKDVAVQANIAVGRVDLDSLLPAASSTSSTSATAPAATGAAKPAAAFSLPGGITAGADITVQQIVFQKQPIDNTKLSVQLANSQLTIKSLTAQLPGATGLGASGVLYADQGQPAFDGGINVNAGNLRGLIDAFAKGAVDSVPGDRLRKFTLASKIGFKNNQLNVSQINGQLDQSTIQGGANIALPDGAQHQQIGYGVSLVIDKLNVDGYLPPAGAKATASSSVPAGGDKQAAGNPLKSLAPLGDINANVEAKIGSLTLNQQQINGLHVLMASGGGAITIKDLSVADFIGGKGAITGKITGLKANPTFDTTFNLTAKEASNVMQMAGAGNAQAGKLGALTLSGKAGGTIDNLSYDATIGIAGIGAQGSAKGTVAGVMNGGIPKLNTTFDLKARDAAALAAVAGAPASAAQQLGAVAASGSAQTSGNDLTYDVTLSAAGIGADGKLAGKVTGVSSDNPQVDTTLNLSAQKPAPLLQMAGLAGPKAAAAGALGVAGTLKGGADKMALDLKLQGLGGTAALAGTVQAKAKPIAFDISLTANHPQFSDLLRIADLPSSGVQAGPLKLAVKAAGTTQKANVSQLDASWGDSSLTGTAAYDATGAKPLVTANISGGTVNVIPFMGSGGNSASTAKAAPAPAGGGAWSTAPLDLSALQAQDANIDAKVTSLVMPNQRIDNLVAKIVIKDGVMTIQTLNGKIYGGGFDLSGTSVNSNGTPKVEAKVVVDKIQMGQVMGGGIAGNQVKGPLSLNLAAGGSGNSQADLVKSLTGNGSLNGTLMIIGQVEQQVGSALLGVLGQKVKAVQGISNTINGVLGNFTGVDNALKGTFNITKGVADTEDFTFTNPKARGTAQGKIDLPSMSFAPMLINLFNGTSSTAFMSVNLQGPVSNPRPSFVPNGAAGSSGISGVDSNGQVQPGLLQQVPGSDSLLNKLGIQPSTGTTVPAGNTTTVTPTTTPTTQVPTTQAPATQTKPTVNVPGLGDIQLPFGKKKKKKDATTTDQSQ